MVANGARIAIKDFRIKKSVRKLIRDANTTGRVGI